MPTVWLLFTRKEVATEEIPDDARHSLEKADPALFRTDQAARFAIRQARERDWKILPGMEYYHQATKIDGIEKHYRGILDLIQICERYQLFK